MSNPAYLATVSDSVKMTREEFVKLLKQFRHHRNIKFGFSVKHTADIEEYKQKTHSSSSVNSVYSLPVTYNTEVTYIM